MSEWKHPDSAFSPYYRRPEGHDAEECLHVEHRCGVGPHPGKGDISFSADVCRHCGRVLRSVRDISWRDYFWARRFNANISQAQPTPSKQEKM